MIKVKLTNKNTEKLFTVGAFYKYSYRLDYPATSVRKPLYYLDWTRGIQHRRVDRQRIFLSNKSSRLL